MIGADAAGMAAAHQALRTARRTGRDLDVTALEMTAHTSYSQCGIPYWIAGDVTSADDLIARSPQRHRDLGVDLRLHHEVTGIDLDRREVTARDHGTGTDVTVGFDALMYAAGAAPLLPEWAVHCGHWPGVHCVKTLDDGFAWQRLLAARPARAVVVGGGYIGVEAAEGLARRGVQTTLVTRSAPMSAALVTAHAQRVVAGLEAVGVRVVVNCPIEGLERVGDGYRLTGEGDTFDADVVALALGVRPRVDVAQAAGLTVAGPEFPHAAGALLPDETQLLADGVWSAGDCCAVRDLISGVPWYVPLGTHANKAARVAGSNIGGGRETFGPVVGTAITRAGAVEVARTGLMPATADDLGLEVVTVELDSTTASGYMPEASPMHLWVMGERGTGRLLGAQITGGTGAGKRIDIVATALTASMTARDVAYLDLAYCPPFSPTWDPVQIACRKLAEGL